MKPFQHTCPAASTANIHRSLSSVFLVVASGATIVCGDGDPMSPNTGGSATASTDGSATDVSTETSVMDVSTDGSVSASTSGSAADASTDSSVDTSTDGSTTEASTVTSDITADSTGADSTGADVTGDVVPPIDECSVAAPEWVFCDSFETGNTWDGSVAEPVLADDDGPFGLPGNHVAQFRVPEGRGGTSLFKDLAQHDALYLRFYIMWEPGHDFTAARHGPGGLHGGTTDCLGCSGSRPSNWFTSTLETVTKAPHTLQAYTYYPGMYMDCADPNGSCWGDMFPCTAGPSYCTNPEHAPQVDAPGMVAGQWYCLEQMIDGGTPTPSANGASGRLDFWIDELEIGPWPGLWLRSSADVKVSALWLYLFHHEEHSLEGILLDNIVVSTAPIGCPGP